MESGAEDGFSFSHANPDSQGDVVAVRIVPWHFGVSFAFRQPYDLHNCGQRPATLIKC